mmetsp:Transcript_12736/g.21476  ORF Transcript_12736/g.21476 Transcript_12736/m.21476 type:complete len:104 (+) Transcript_12736:114-425(+)
MVHPNMTGSQYALLKLKQMLKSITKISIYLFLLPGIVKFIVLLIIKRVKHYRKNKDEQEEGWERKQILKDLIQFKELIFQFFRQIAWLTTATYTDLMLLRLLS